jgi:hypothetical protein
VLAIINDVLDEVLDGEEAELALRTVSRRVLRVQGRSMIRIHPSLCAR